MISAKTALPVDNWGIRHRPLRKGLKIMRISWLPKVIFFIALVVGGAWHLIGSPVHACPMCSESLPDNTQPPGFDAPQADGITTNSNGSLAKGFYYSILLMLTVLFSLAGGLGGMLYWAVRKSDNNPQSPLTRLADPPQAQQ